MESDSGDSGVLPASRIVNAIDIDAVTLAKFYPKDAEKHGVEGAVTVAVTLDCSVCFEVRQSASSRDKNTAMNDSTSRISPLRQRMIEDMRMRKLSSKTQTAYIRSVRYLARYLRRRPDTATVEELRNVQLQLVDRGTSPIALNATITHRSMSRAEIDRSQRPQMHWSRVGTSNLNRNHLSDLGLDADQKNARSRRRRRAIPATRGR